MKNSEAKLRSIAKLILTADKISFAKSEHFITPKLCFGVIIE